MTLPIERTRALRWGWEFLWDLRSIGDLTTGQYQTVEQTLAHYPTPMEISVWAQLSLARTRHSPGDVRWLEPEPHNLEPLGGPSGAPNSLDRHHVTPVQRMQALSTASEFMHRDLRDAPNLTAAQQQARNALIRNRLYNTRFVWWSADDRAWENMAPIGHEFGSPDYERLAQEDLDRAKSNLARLVAECIRVPAKSNWHCGKTQWW